LRRGLLVVFPTETVYGLGANATDPAAVARIYKAKGRPSNNPLIVHVPDKGRARAFAAEWPDVAERLAGAFWPGPLSLVVRKKDIVPDIVTAGLDTVALRCPAQEVALELLREAGVPIAAPSANPSGRVSPTRVEHLAPPILRAAAVVLDDGPCSGGIESTVLDLTQTPPRILRPGLVARPQLEEAAGMPIVDAAVSPDGKPRSPGLLGRHYAPTAQVILAGSSAECEALVQEHVAARRRVAHLCFGHCEPLSEASLTIRMPADPIACAQVLYNTLVKLDNEGVEVVVGMLPSGDAWEGIRDRLRRAALR